MQVGIVSDTHGHVHNTLDAVRMLESLQVDQVIHCGDIGSDEIPALFSCPTHFVFGNVDRHDELAMDAAITREGHTSHGRFGSLEIAGKRIAFLHGDDTRRFRETVESQDWDLVCYGHTHKAEHHMDGKTLVLNPGAVYRANPHTIALVQFPQLEVYSTAIH